MKEQHYANHKKIVPLYHFGLSLLALAIFLGSCFKVGYTLYTGEGLPTALLFLAISVLLLFFFIFIRANALKAQDRAIRAEENLRHYVLTGRLLDRRLTMQQIVALRFAEDEEFPSLCIRSLEENLSPDDIKKAIRTWKADHDRL